MRRAVIAITLFLAASSARAQRWGSARSAPQPASLQPNLRVVPAGSGWVVRGGRNQTTVFLGDGTRRLLVLAVGSMFYTDDLGVSWTTSSWSGPPAPLFAFGPDGTFGVAARGGELFTSRDAGASWSYLEALPGVDVVGLTVMGPHAVLQGSLGGAWLLVQGSELVTLVETGEGSTIVTREADALRIDGPRGSWRLQRNGSWAAL